MKTFLHLLRRELAEAPLFFTAAILLGLLPYALAPLAAESPGELTAMRIVIARAMVLLFLAGAALLQGVRWLASGLRGRRSFELARPVSAWALCSSKLAASIVYVLGGTWLASLPTGMAALRVDRGVFETFLPRILRKDPEAAWQTYLALTGIAEGTDPAWLALLKMGLVAAVAALVLLVAAQTLTLAAIHPGWTSLADAGALFVFITLVGYTYVRCSVSGASGLWLHWLPRLGLAIVGLGILAAWQSFRGGSQPGGAHRRHALFFDLGLLALGFLSVNTIHDELRPNPSRIESFAVAVPSADFSRWVLSGAQSPADFEPVLVVDPATRKTIYLGPRYIVGSGQLWLSPDGRRAFARRFGGISTYELGESRVTGWGGAGVPSSPDLYRDFNETRDLQVLAFPGNLSAKRLDGHKWLPAGKAQGPELEGKPSFVVHRQGSKFDVLVHHPGGQEPGARPTLRRFGFDAETGQLLPLETLTYPPGRQLGLPVDLDWWREALPLLDAGADFAQIEAYRGLFALSQGRGLRRGDEAGPEPAKNLEWILFDARNPRLASFETPAGFEPVGEIRPGLLLMGTSQGQPATYKAWLEAIREKPELQLHTLAVDLASGRLVRRLDGLLPVKHPAAGRRPWLIDRDLAPYDLDSADAEPRPFLPWRPRRATSEEADS